MIDRSRLGLMYALLSGLPSGVMSPNLTVDACCNLSTNELNLSLLILPTGSTRTRTRAGAMGERGSAPIGTLFGRIGQFVVKVVRPMLS